VINGTPKIILSRAAPAFLERLFELEVPEIYDGLIVIKNVVREPGERAKVAVESYDERIDPVGACVGMKGSRIHPVVRELENENIDIINYTDNLELYIARALSPAKVGSMKINQESGRVSVFMKPDQVSLAIGRGGANIKLASRLVGMEIDVFREAIDYEEDISLDEFQDEIEPWVLAELKKIGLDTGRAVLAVKKDDIVRRTELEEEMVDDVYRIIRQEFADDEDLDENSLDAAKKRVAGVASPEAKADSQNEEAAVNHASETEITPEHTPLETEMTEETKAATEDAGASSPAESAQ
jgi:N utilization substance protein A